MLNREALRDELIHTDNEFRTLWEEHQDCERRLSTLRAKTMPSAEDEANEKQIKLHKLTLKDRMETIMRTRTEAQVFA